MRVLIRDSLANNSEQLLRIASLCGAIRYERRCNLISATNSIYTKTIHIQRNHANLSL